MNFWPRPGHQGSNILGATLWPTRCRSLIGTPIQRAARRVGVRQIKLVTSGVYENLKVPAQADVNCLMGAREAGRTVAH